MAAEQSCPANPAFRPRNRHHNRQRVEHSIGAMRQRNNNSYIRYKIFVFK